MRTPQHEQEQGINWIFTLKNPKQLLKFEKMHPNVRNLVYQLVHEGDQEPYYLGYVRLVTSRYSHWLQKQIPNAEFSIRKVTHDQAIEMCIDHPHQAHGPWLYGDFHMPVGQAQIDYYRDKENRFLSHSIERYLKLY